MDRARPNVPTHTLAWVGLSLLVLPWSMAQAEDAPPAPTEVAVIVGTEVNLRVGPRPDGRPVAQLDDGTVLLVVEHLDGWVCVHVPSGFLAAVSADHVEPVGTDAVRVTASRLNLRVEPPVEGGPVPGAFRDRAERGALLHVMKREGSWLWVLAPADTRAYVSAQFVRTLGPLADHEALVASAAARRTATLEAVARERRERAALLAGDKLRVAIGAAQQALYRLRIDAGITRTPVVEASTALEAALEASAEAPIRVRKLARAIREDLEAELEIRAARKDAEVARLRGLDPPAEPPPAARVDRVSLSGEIRWEAAPTWRNGGEWVLWLDDEPRFVLQLTTGLPHPLPDFRANADQGARTVEGRQPGERVFGLPVIEVTAIRP
ncbi:MAG: SH3 domain-containing protein [Planctomycetota bacterium]|nr:SH3 domain-containing protein [Planctomycetota bacterium]